MWKDNYVKYCQKIIILDVVKRYLFRFLISNISWNLETVEEGLLCTWLALKVKLFGNIVEYDALSDLCDFLDFLCSSVNHGSLGDNLSRSLSLFSLKITFHMLLLIMAWSGRDKATRIFGKELFGMLYFIFQSWFLCSS